MSLVLLSVTTSLVLTLVLLCVSGIGAYGLFWPLLGFAE
jgi:hypothetical protein